MSPNFNECFKLHGIVKHKTMIFIQTLIIKPTLSYIYCLVSDFV